jgi:DNA-binding beta-propeller fold protein YncE
MIECFLVFLFCSVGTDEPRAAEIISTIAGTGQQGYDGDGGPAVKARLNQPFDVAFDSEGNTFFTDTFNQRIRRIDHQSGVITTVAGSGRTGFDGDGGPAAAARLNEPYGLVLDAHRNLYFADRLNRRVRRVDGATGTISTVAGNGEAAYSGDGGPADRAGLVEPNGVALDPEARHLYIADVAGHRVRRVELQTGRIQTFAGTGKPPVNGDERDGGPADRASTWGARAVDVGRDGTVYILEREGNVLRAVDPRTGQIATIAGIGAKSYSGDGGPARVAAFNGPKELAVDRDGGIFIVDTENHAIRAIDPVSKQIRTLAGTGRAGGEGDGGPANRARLDRPHGVAVAPDGSVWIADTNNHRIRRVATGR